MNRLTGHHKIASRHGRLPMRAARWRSLANRRAFSIATAVRLAAMRMAVACSLLKTAMCGVWISTEPMMQPITDIGAISDARHARIDVETDGHDLMSLIGLLKIIGENDLARCQRLGMRTGATHLDAG